jgi:REP element-mobilizing transposase RayT
MIGTGVGMGARVDVVHHYVWSTWRRAPLVEDAIRDRIYWAIRNKCTQLKSAVIALGGTEDHVHLLVRPHATVSIAKLIGEAKGFSSFMATHVLRPGRFFRWQEQYATVSIGPEDVPTVEKYIRQQREHHSHATVIPILESLDTD